MNRNLQTKLNQSLKEHNAKRKWLSIVISLCIIVAGVTSYILINPADTQEEKTYCGYEEHAEHSEVCYEEVKTLICPLSEEGHIHSESCYESILSCGFVESDEHHHDESCFTSNTVCGMEECEPHQHTEECWKVEWKRVCERPIHEHTLQCFSNPNADLEIASVWERALARVELTGNWNEDVLAIAQTQLGYSESTANYKVQEDSTTMKGYTRYGEWYGEPYGDWCAMFCSFCLHYAGVDHDLMPLEASCQRWINELSKPEYNLFCAADTYTPVPGDLIFFDWEVFDPEHLENRDADHIGFVAELIYDETTNEITKIKTIEGNTNNAVAYAEYSLNDEHILGFGRLPENPSLPRVMKAAKAAAAPIVVPACDCNPKTGGTFQANHKGNCAMRKFVNSSIKNFTAEELYSIWDQLPVDAQDYIHSSLEANPAKADVLTELNHLIESGGEDQSDIPACDCTYPPEELALHADACPRKAYVRALCSEKTAEEIFSMWSALPTDIQDAILFFLDNEHPEKLAELLELLTEEPENLETVYTDGLGFTLSGVFSQNAQTRVSTVNAALLDRLKAFLGDSGEHILSGAYDISVMDGENKYEPDGPVEVIISGLDIGDMDVASLKAKVYHFVDLDIDDLLATDSMPEVEVEVLDAAIEDDGSLRFETDNFSIFYYTVDFHHEDVTFSIEGGTSIRLSELFAQLGMEYDVDDVVSVTFSDPSLLTVGRVYDYDEENDVEYPVDWYLLSTAPFLTEETLTIEFSDGTTLELLVTDAQSNATTTSGPTNVSVNLTWLNNTSSNENVVVSLLRDGVPTGQTLTLNSSNNWRGQFTNVPAGNYSIDFTSDDNCLYSTNNTITENNVWNRVSSLTNGKTYVFVHDTNRAVQNSSGTTLSRGNVTVSGNTLSDPSTGVQWVYNGTLRNVETKNYLRLTSSGASVSSSQSSNFTFTSGRLKLSSSSRYLRYNNRYTSTTSTGNALSLVPYEKSVGTTELSFAILAEKTQFNPSENATSFEHNKTIDYLNDGVRNPDTNIQNEDMYRLYLDMTGKQEPIDLLIVVDASASMSNNSDMTGIYGTENMRRDNAITEFLNGSTSSSTSQGFLAYFLGLNPNNKVSVVNFYGVDVNRNSNQVTSSRSYPYTEDSSVLPELDWTNTNRFVSCTAKSNNGTNYEAGLQRATDQFSMVSGDGHRKLMIFLSDGVPTFFQINANDVGTTCNGYTITQDDVGKRWGNGKSNNANYQNGCKEPSKRAFDDFMQSNPGVTVFTIGVSEDINSTDLGSSQSPEVLQYMANKGHGAYLSVTESMSTLRMSIESIFYPKGVTITDDLSKYVRYFDQQPDVLVTMTHIATGQKTVLYQNGASTGVLTDDNKPIFSDVVYTAGDTGENPTGSTGTVKAVFDSNYAFSPEYTYTLSFNVKTTQTAYNEYATDGYNAAGDKKTDYGTNHTSSEQPGFYSNDSATVSYKVSGGDITDTYKMPVIQVNDFEQSIRFIKTDVMGSLLLEGAEFALYGADESGNMLTEPISGLDNMVSDENGVFSPEDLSLPAGIYYLVETDAPDGYVPMNAPLKLSVETGSITVYGDGISSITSTVFADTETGICTVYVKNSNGYELPETGGIGIPLFTLGGLVLMTSTLMYGCMLRRKRERRAE